MFSVVELDCMEAAIELVILVDEAFAVTSELTEALLP